MRRLRRWLFGSISALSLMVWVFSATYWIAHRHVRFFPPLTLLSSGADGPIRRLQTDSEGLALQMFDPQSPQGGLVRHVDVDREFLGFRHYREGDNYAP